MMKPTRTKQKAVAVMTARNPRWSSSVDTSKGAVTPESHDGTAEAAAVVAAAVAAAVDAAAMESDIG